VTLFYSTVPTNLNHYPLQTVLCWLQEDLRYIRESGVAQGGIASIKADYSIDYFDLVLIDGSEFTGEAELEEVIGARWIVLDDINAYKNYKNYHRLAADPAYHLVAENWNLRNGYALFRHCGAPLPVHFFTIVLNGMPFMSHHIGAFQHLPFRWHWHIVEGVAELVGDTAWSRPGGGHIPEGCHNLGRSVDGTSSYIDELKRLYPDNISIYRKPEGQFWNGKLEMVNAPLEAINEPCLLWEIDSDECWTHAQLCAGWSMFHEEPERSAAFYWCRFFVGNHLVVNSRNCYSQMSGLEWLRTWRYRPGCRWVAHEPPRLICQGPDGRYDLAQSRPFSNDETEARGLVFQHFAYVTADQVRFKEKYYGYQLATYHWLRLQKESDFPVRLGEYLPWVPDGTTVDTAFSQGILPLPVNALPHVPDCLNCRIVIDGVFFQYYVTGITRVWMSLLEELSGSRLASGVVILDRGRTAPRVPGYRYLDLPAHDEKNIDREREMLQAVCDQYEADLFISTWHTSPISTPSLLMVHDMLPELLLGDRRLEEARWREKATAIEHAAGFVSVSENTAKDLLQWYPGAATRPIHVMHNGVAESFRPAMPHQISKFRERYGIVKPYYLFVGPREWYKNFRILLDAFIMLPDADSYCIVSPHGNELEQEFFGHPATGAVVLTGRMTEEELVAAYSGAVALVYPSRYEGFGLPLLEGMGCGCPVIASTAPALVEVSGEAAIHVSPDDAAALALAMVGFQQQEKRIKYVRRGLERAAAFSWGHSASQLVRAIQQII
jgi:glycosyltransferase involved in cell wall biosynthesis